MVPDSGEQWKRGSEKAGKSLGANSDSFTVHYDDIDLNSTLTSENTGERGIPCSVKA
jgi:hypothetical protein